VRAVSLGCVPVAALSVYLTYSRFGAVAVAIAVGAAVALSKNRWTAVANTIVAGVAPVRPRLGPHRHHEDPPPPAGAGRAARRARRLLAMVWRLAARVTQRAGRDRACMGGRAARGGLAASALPAIVLGVALNGSIWTALG